MAKISIFQRVNNYINTLAQKSYASVILPWQSYFWDKSPDTLIREGFQGNSAVYHAIDKLGQKCSEIPLKLYRKQNGEKIEIENHPILDLLKRPNSATGSYDSFVKMWVSFLKITGTSYFYKEDKIVLNGKVPTEVYVLPSQLVSAEYDTLGRPKQFKVRFDKNKETVLPIKDDVIPPIKAVRNFNPNLSEGGQSPLGPLKHAILLLNETNEYAVNFVKNRCTPPGLLTTDKTLTTEQREQLQKVLTERYSGTDNAGIPMILWGGLEYTAMGGGTEHVAVLEGQLDREREIARTLGVPPMLLGIPGDTTYNNLLEAKKDFVMATCYPLMKLFAAALTNWLLPGEDLYLEPCIDGMPEVMEYRAKSLADLETISYLSLNEKREMAGFETKDGDVYDDLLIGGGQILASDYDLFSEIDISDDEEDGEEVEEDVEEESDDDDAN